MHQSLLPKFQEIETRLNQLAVDLSEYPVELLRKKPAPDAWSVLEVMQHMMIAERGSFAYVKKKTSYPDSLKNAGLSGYYRKLQLYIFMRLPVKVKAPAVVNENNFDKNQSLEQVLAEWRKLRNELKAFLDNAPDEWTSKLTYRHGFAGRLTFDGMLMFFRDHLIRHRKQIDRTLMKLNKN